MELHELGHATVEWLAGRFAIPLPMVTISFSDERNLLVVGAVSLGLVVLIRRGLDEETPALTVCAGVLLALQAWLTWFVPQQTLNALVSAAGVGGEIVFGALLVAAFHVRLPARWHWREWRYLGLLIGSASLVHNLVRWLAARTDSDRIPWGSALGGDGDMDRLHGEFGWSLSRMTTTYLVLIGLGFGLILVMQAWRLRSDVRARPQSGAALQSIG